MYSFGFFLYFSPLGYFCGCESGRGEEPSGGNVLRLIQIRLATPSLERIWPVCQDKIAASTNRRFKLDKRRQLFLRSHDETLSIATMRVSNPDRSRFGIDG